MTKLSVTSIEETAAAAPTNLSEAMQNAAAADDLSRDLSAAVTEGVTGKAKTFSTHSQALAGRLMAEERSLRETVADIDAKIAALNEERTDAMLAYSGVEHALRALETGRA